jgi:hypothetical protein
MQVLPSGCESYGSCKVQGTVLRQSGSVTETKIAKVPLTLSAGTYKVYVDNGEAFARQEDSEGLSLTVQPARIVTPSITGLDYMALPIAGSQFIVRVRGISIDTTLVRIVVTGPGCQSFRVCTVSNSTLRNFGAISASLIEKVPLTRPGAASNSLVKSRVEDLI